MFTNIESVMNQQPSTDRGGVAFVNRQPGHAWESWACEPGFEGQVGRYLPIPRTGDFQQGLWVYTIRGKCRLIDNDWKISGKWEDGSTVTFLEKDGGVGGNIKLKIGSAGDISMSKA